MLHRRRTCGRRLPMRAEISAGSIVVAIVVHIIVVAIHIDGPAAAVCRTKSGFPDCRRGRGGEDAAAAEGAGAPETAAAGCAAEAGGMAGAAGDAARATEAPAVSARHTGVAEPGGALREGVVRRDRICQRHQD